MREIVIVIADLYWPADVPEAELLVPPGALPGLSQASRFGQGTPLPGSWPGWLAQWLGREDLAQAAPASLAASLAQSPLPVAGGGPLQAWIATPVHLLAGMSSVHLERRGVLHLAPADATSLADDFAGTFADSGFTLLVLPSSDLLLIGPALPQVVTVAPARAVGLPLAQSQPRGEGATVLRRLGAEIEMWLHAHPVNDRRARRGEPPVSALWLWGGGPLLTEARRAAQPGEIVFAADASTRGLLDLQSASCASVPDTLAGVLGYAPADRAAVVLEAAPVLQTHPEWTLIEALTQLDADYIAPALEALRRRSLERLGVIANDRQLAVRAQDVRRWWRRARPALTGFIR